MPGKGKMPPELLAHFKKKSDKSSKGEPKEESNEESTDKDRRKEAVKKARMRIEKKKKS